MKDQWFTGAGAGGLVFDEVIDAVGVAEDVMTWLNDSDGETVE